LGDAGFVVAAMSHPGDNGNDSSQSEALSVWASRPADMVRLLDFMLDDWKDRGAIDPARMELLWFLEGRLYRVGARRCYYGFPESCILLYRRHSILRTGSRRRRSAKFAV
jgi:hypothetical protein